MHKIQLFQMLSWDQRRWLWSAYWRLWPTLIRIKLKQSAWLREKIHLVEARVKEPTGSHTMAESMFESVRLAARLHSFDAQCLPRSIVLADMLRARGINAQVLIGVSRQGGKLASHAWVEVDGVMVGEPQSVHRDFTLIQS